MFSSFEFLKQVLKCGRKISFYQNLKHRNMYEKYYQIYFKLFDWWVECNRCLFSSAIIALDWSLLLQTAQEIFQFLQLMKMFPELFETTQTDCFTIVADQENVCKGWQRWWWEVIQGGMVQSSQFNGISNINVRITAAKHK